MQWQHHWAHKEREPQRWSNHEEVNVYIAIILTPILDNVIILKKALITTTTYENTTTFKP